MGKMKRCPKCGRIMMNEQIKSGRRWQVIWHCICGHDEAGDDEKQVDLSQG